MEEQHKYGRETQTIGAGDVGSLEDAIGPILEPTEVKDPALFRLREVCEQVLSVDPSAVGFLLQGDSNNVLALFTSFIGIVSATCGEDAPMVGVRCVSNSWGFDPHGLRMNESGRFVITDEALAQDRGESWSFPRPLRIIVTEESVTSLEAAVQHAKKLVGGKSFGYVVHLL